SAPGLRAARGLRRRAGARTALRLAAQRALQLPGADFLAPDRRKQIVRLVESEALGEILEACCAHALAPDLALDGRAARCDHSGQLAAVEPLAHLVARPRAPDVAERRVEPVA